MNPHANSIRLGDSFLTRAKIIFGVLLVLAFTSISISIYVALVDGTIDSKIVKPIKLSANAFKDGLNYMFYTPSSTSSGVPEPFQQIDTKKTTEVIINNNTDTQESQPYVPPQTKVEIIYPTYQVSQGKSYEESLKELEAWSEQKKAENQKWFEEQSAKNRQASQESYEADVKLMKEDLEAWKKKHGFE